MAEKTGKSSASAKKEQKRGFWKGVRSEWRKILWPNREELAKETVLVVLISVVLGLVITGIDSLALQVVNWILSI